jgi:hypothetical protein
MLLNEFRREYRTVQRLQPIIAQQEVNNTRQEARMEKQEKQIETLTRTLQKVSDQIALCKPAPRIVSNN